MHICTAYVLTAQSVSLSLSVCLCVLVTTVSPEKRQVLSVDMGQQQNGEILDGVPDVQRYLALLRGIWPYGKHFIKHSTGFWRLGKRVSPAKVY